MLSIQPVRRVVRKRCQAVDAIVTCSAVLSVKFLMRAQVLRILLPMTRDAVDKLGPKLLVMMTVLACHRFARILLLVHSEAEPSESRMIDIGEGKDREVGGSAPMLDMARLTSVCARKRGV
jgi:hypothetical protein